jgi:hypothetical protein
MSVVFSVIDAPFPHVCALYRCDCGRELVRYGDEAALLPPGWAIDRPADLEDSDVTCPACAAAGAQRPS